MKCTRFSCCAFLWFAQIVLLCEDSACDHMRQEEAGTSLIRWVDTCVSAVRMRAALTGCRTCHSQHVCSPRRASPRAAGNENRSGFFSGRSAAWSGGNEFQEAEHANKFIIPAWFRSNYHFASKAIQDWVALVTLSRVWIQINICISVKAHDGRTWQADAGVAKCGFSHILDDDGDTHVNAIATELEAHFLWLWIRMGWQEHHWKAWRELVTPCLSC